MHLTQKQIELLTVIAKGNGPGEHLDLDQILDRLKYETTKQSLQFSIRALINKGLIFKRGVEKRRGRQRQVLQATTTGCASVGVTHPHTKHYIEAMEDPTLGSVFEDLDPEDLLEL